MHIKCTQKMSEMGEKMGKDVRDKLKLIMEDRGCIQAAIAIKANMEPDKLSLTLSKKRKLDANELFNLCDALGITPVELMQYKADAPEKEVV